MVSADQGKQVHLNVRGRTYPGILTFMLFLWPHILKVIKATSPILLYFAVSQNGTSHRETPSFQVSFVVLLKRVRQAEDEETREPKASLLEKQRCTDLRTDTHECRKCNFLCIS